MRRKQIALVSHAEDLHALAVRDALGSYEDVLCFIIESNRIAENGSLHWSASREAASPSTIPAVGGAVHPAHLDAIWWRRVNYPQRLPQDLTQPASVDLINNDARASLLGILSTDFRGAWINEPESTTRADNKLVQLRAAQDAGFAIPRTIVSQDVREVRHFCASLEHQVIVKGCNRTHARDYAAVLGHLFPEPS